MNIHGDITSQIQGELFNNPDISSLFPQLYGCLQPPSLLSPWLIFNSEGLYETLRYSTVTMTPFWTEGQCCQGAFQSRQRIMFVHQSALGFELDRVCIHPMKHFNLPPRCTSVKMHPIVLHSEPLTRTPPEKCLLIKPFLNLSYMCRHRLPNVHLYHCRFL